MLPIAASTHKSVTPLVRSWLSTMDRRISSKFTDSIGNFSINLLAMWHNCIVNTTQPLILVLASLVRYAKRDSDKHPISGCK
jgi:hypothetical protein